MCSTAPFVCTYCRTAVPVLVFGSQTVVETGTGAVCWVVCELVVAQRAGMVSCAGPQG